MNRSLEYDIVKETLEGMTAEQILPLWNEYCDENHYKEILEYDEFTLSDFISGMKEFEIAKMIIRGTFKPDSEYFTVDGKGNFLGMTEREALEEIDYNSLADFILQDIERRKDSIPELNKAFEDIKEEMNE